jgi:hypothetical protein
MKMTHQTDEWEEWRRAYMNTIEWEEWRRAYMNTMMNFRAQYKPANFVREQRAGSKRLCYTE